jgi:hypothetical protein
MALRAKGPHAVPAPGGIAATGRPLPPFEVALRAFCGIFPAHKRLAVAIGALDERFAPLTAFALGEGFIALAIVSLEVASRPLAAGAAIFPPHIWLALAVGALDERLAPLAIFALGEGSVAARRTLAKRLRRACRLPLASRSVIAPEVTFRSVAG